MFSLHSRNSFPETLIRQIVLKLKWNTHSPICLKIKVHTFSAVSDWSNIKSASLCHQTNWRIEKVERGKETVIKVIRSFFEKETDNKATRLFLHCLILDILCSLCRQAILNNLLSFLSLFSSLRGHAYDLVTSSTQAQSMLPIQLIFRCTSGLGYGTEGRYLTKI